MDKIKEYYEGNRISFQKLADNSEKISGRVFTLDQIKKQSQADGGWKKPKLREADRLRIIGDKLFEAIEDSEDMAVRDLTSLVNSYMQVVSKAPPDINVDDNKPTIDQIKDLVRAKK